MALTTAGEFPYNERNEKKENNNNRIVKPESISAADKFFLLLRLKSENQLKVYNEIRKLTLSEQNKENLEKEK